jgi:hypothetical protein
MVCDMFGGEIPPLEFVFERDRRYFEENPDAVCGVRLPWARVMSLWSSTPRTTTLTRSCWTTWWPAAQLRACWELAYEMVRAASRSETARGLRFGSGIWSSPRSLLRCRLHTRSRSGTTQNGKVIIPAGSPPGATVLAIMAETHPDAIKILGTTYSGTLSFDIFMGKGTCRGVGETGAAGGAHLPGAGAHCHARSGPSREYSCQPRGEARWLQDRRGPGICGPREVHLHGLYDGKGLFGNRRRLKLLDDL